LIFSISIGGRTGIAPIGIFARLSVSSDESSVLAPSVIVLVVDFVRSSLFEFSRNPKKESIKRALLF